MVVSRPRAEVRPCELSVLKPTLEREARDLLANSDGIGDIP